MQIDTLLKLVLFGAAHLACSKIPHWIPIHQSSEHFRGLSQDPVCGACRAFWAQSEAALGHFSQVMGSCAMPKIDVHMMGSLVQILDSGIPREILIGKESAAVSGSTKAFMHGQFIHGEARYADCMAFLVGKLNNSTWLQCRDFETSHYMKIH